MLKLEIIEKQIILLTKNRFYSYLEENHIYGNYIEIIKRMISYYCALNIEHVKLENVYHWVVELYAKLADTKEFNSMNTRLLLFDVADALSPFPNMSNMERMCYVINKLLGKIAHTEITGLQKLGIELGSIDNDFLKELKKAYENI